MKCNYLHADIDEYECVCLFQVAHTTDMDVNDDKGTIPPLIHVTKVQYDQLSYVTINDHYITVRY